jgi:hypothetical protein
MPLSHPTRLALAALALAALACVFSARTAPEPPPVDFATGSPPPVTQLVIEPYSSPTASLPAPVPSETPASIDPPIPTDLPSPTNPPTAAPAAMPYGCLQPSDDYTIVHVAPDMVVNQRTLTMLAHAQELYGGSHDFVKAITQGSYNPGLDASFGTHDGGGAVDISVLDQSTYKVLTDQLPVFVLALREAGFAAWVRETGELYDGSPIHIHAIAVGDKDLSPAARRQLDGPEGYFRGFNGLPVDPPAPDKWGAPIVCPWMLDLGFADLRGAP